MIGSKARVSHEDLQNKSERRGLLSNGYHGRVSMRDSSSNLAEQSSGTHDLPSSISPRSQSSPPQRIRTREFFIGSLVLMFVVMVFLAGRTATRAESSYIDPYTLIGGSQNSSGSIRNSNTHETVEVEPPVGGSILPYINSILENFGGNSHQYPTDRIVLDKLAKDDICGPFTSQGRFRMTWQERYLRVVEAIQHGNDTAIRPKYLVFSPMSNQGLGDNQKGILFAMYAAVMTDRMLLLEWYEGIDLSTFWEPNAYDWRVENTLGSRNRTDWKEKHTYVRVHSSMRKDFGPNTDPRSGVLDKEWFEEDNWKNDIVHYTGNSGSFMEAILRWDPNINYRAGHTFMYNMHPDYVWGCVFDFLFKFSDRLHSAIDVASKQLYGDNRENVIAMGAHARLGDRTWTGNDVLVYTPQGMWSAYGTCLTKVEEYFKMDDDPREVKWVVFSDNTEFRDAAQQASSKSIRTEINPVHIRSSSHNENDPAFEDELGIFVEQALISQVDMLVMSSSGYSEMAVAQGFFGYDRVFHYDKLLCKCEIKDLPPSEFGKPPLFRDQLERVHPNRQWFRHPKCGKSTRGV